MANNLGDFVKEMAALMTDAQLRLPLKDERPWHLLFFELKRLRQAVGRPTFLDRLVFDWDGPSPKCQELSEFIHALHWNANVTASNPTYETLTLSPDVAVRWRPDAPTEFHQAALAQARTKFQSAS
jgi:hypothetical protein